MLAAEHTKGSTHTLAWSCLAVMGNYDDDNDDSDKHTQLAKMGDDEIPIHMLYSTLTIVDYVINNQ